MVATRESPCSVFRRIAHHQHVEWPTYDSTPLYDRTSLAGLESDVRVVSSAWFTHPDHDSLEQLVCSIPLAYFRFEAHDCYGSSTRYEMDTLFRVFVLKELHGWQHETSLVEYLDSHPALCERLELETAPDQSTLWRTWNERFTRDLRETIQKAARTILVKAQNADVAVPRDPERNLPDRGHDATESDPDDQAILDEAGKITDHVSRVVFPAFSLNRGEGCEIPENAYWGLQTYLGLRENLAVNEGARSFIHESTRDLPWRFYGLTEEGRALLSEAGLLRAEATLQDMYARLDTTPEIDKYAQAPRPKQAVE